MSEFFLAINPPRTTAQQQKTAIINGKPRRYDPPSLKAAKCLLLAALAAHKPKEAYTYRQGVRFGIIKPTARKVVFYFERCEKPEGGQ